MKYNIEWINIDLLHEDPSNPNSMNEREFNALIQEISKYGIIEPIVTRACKCNTIPLEHRCIIGGEHRFKAARQLNMKEVPCINLDVNDTQAKMLMVNLNMIRGRVIPLKLANLIVDMSKSIPIDEICKGFYITKDEIKDMLASKSVTTNVISGNKIVYKDRAKIKRALSSSTKSNLKVLSILLSKEQYEEVITILDSIADKHNCTRGEALILLCKRAKQFYN
jgi:ParB-like chromosome segregation protein Spo0J